MFSIHVYTDKAEKDILTLLESQAKQLDRLEALIMQTQADLDAAITAIQTEIDLVTKDVNDAVAALLAKIGSLGITDLTTEVTALTDLNTKLQAIDAAAIAAKPA